MQYKNQLGKLMDIDPERGVGIHVVRGGESESIFERFTDAELLHLSAWVAKQPTVNDMVVINDWPGWNEVARRMQVCIGTSCEIATAIIARLAKSRDNK